MKIPGIKSVPLKVNSDPRGTLIEIFREGWQKGLQARQVNVMFSRGGSLRGSHVHRSHTDWFVMAMGRGVVGIRDVRRRSPAFGKTELLEIRAEAPQALVVPPGVIHGMFFPVDGILVTIESMFYDPTEELKVKWDDPELGIEWPFSDTTSTEIDAYSVKDLMEKIEPWQKTFKV
jgi:dTDP-4-dehydrorhamnose 3,5-epimerase